MRLSLQVHWRFTFMNSFMRSQATDLFADPLCDNVSVPFGGGDGSKFPSFLHPIQWAYSFDNLFLLFICQGFSTYIEIFNCLHLMLSFPVNEILFTKCKIQICIIHEVCCMKLWQQASLVGLENWWIMLCWYHHNRISYPKFLSGNLNSLGESIWNLIITLGNIWI